MSIDAESPFLDGIGVEQVAAYLGSTGWRRRIDFPRPELIVFDQTPPEGGEPMTALIPSATTMHDFRRQLARLLDALSSLEARSPYKIAQDMRSPGTDRLYARVISDMTAGGSIPLPFASVLLDGLRDLVTSAACAEEDPRPFFVKTTRVGTEHARTWRFGQTQLGSFVASIECPVVPTVDSAPDADAPPLSRRVTARIMRGLGALDQAVRDGRPDALLHAYREGLNANMCEALLSLKDPGHELQLELSVHWSKRLAAPGGVLQTAKIEGRGFELLDATAKTLRTPRESSERAFTGEIIKLYREAGDERTAVLRFVDEGRRIQAKLHLGVEEYAIACDAHRDGKLVTLKGRLERVSHKQWSLFGIGGFGTVDQSTDIEKNRIVKEVLDP